MVEPQTLANRVRGYREARGLTRPQLATAADVNPSYLSRLERGKGGGSIFELFKVAQALGVTLEDMLAEKPDADVRLHVQSRLPSGEKVAIVIDRILDTRANRPTLQPAIDHMLDAIAELGTRTTELHQSET